MNRGLYTLLIILAMPIIVLRLLLRSIKSPAYRHRIGERFARFSVPESFIKEQGSVWIHCVSVGETMAAVPLVKALQEKHPSMAIVITTMTPTGSQRVIQQFGESVFHVYMPYDLPLLIRSFIKALKPKLLIIMETELWPNTIHVSHQLGVKILIANARLSQRSAHGYSRVAKLSGAMLANIDYFAVQAQADGDRFTSLGAKPGRVVVTGSLKFHRAEVLDSGVEQESTAKFFINLSQQQRPMIIAASTRDGEEEKILTAFKHCLQQLPDLVLVLVPRHPQRFDSVAKLCAQQGFSLMRRSSEQLLQDSTQILLGDSMGEMTQYYGLAKLAFVGGSLVDTGCQNVLEPAALGMPILVGPSQYNFENICRQLEHCGALQTVDDEEALGIAIVAILGDGQLTESMAKAGRQVVADNQQALPRHMEIIESLL